MRPGRVSVGPTAPRFFAFAVRGLLVIYRPASRLSPFARPRPLLGLGTLISMIFPPGPTPARTPRPSVASAARGARRAGHEGAGDRSPRDLARGESQGAGVRRILYGVSSDAAGDRFLGPVSGGRRPVASRCCTSSYDHPTSYRGQIRVERHDPSPHATGELRQRLRGTLEAPELAAPHRARRPARRRQRASASSRATGGPRGGTGRGDYAALITLEPLPPRSSTRGVELNRSRSPPQPRPEVRREVADRLARDFISANLRPHSLAEGTTSSSSSSSARQGADLADIAPQAVPTTRRTTRRAARAAPAEP